MRAIVTIILLSAISALKAQDFSDSKYFSLMGEADKAIEQQRWEQADSCLMAALRLEPGNPSNVILMSNLGMVRFHAGKDSLALATLNDAHKFAPHSVIVLENRGQVLAAMGREREAYEDYTRALDIDSTLTETRLYRGMMALHFSDTATAETDFLMLERHHPEMEGTLIGLATLYSETNRFSKAIPYFNKLIEKDPTPEYYGGRAYCFLATENYTDASSDIAEGLKLNPDDGLLYLYRAILNKLRFRPEDAKADSKRAIAAGIPESYVRLYIP